MSQRSFIKSSREALDRRDYATALRVAELGLVEDDKSYTLLVFRALALQNLQRTEEAVESYRLASNLQPSQMLAWQVCLRRRRMLRSIQQGLASLLETEGRWSDAIEPLEKLAALSTAYSRPHHPPPYFIYFFTEMQRKTTSTQGA